MRCCMYSRLLLRTPSCDCKSGPSLGVPTSSINCSNASSSCKKLPSSWLTAENGELTDEIESHATAAAWCDVSGGLLLTRDDCWLGSNVRHGGTIERARDVVRRRQQRW